MQVDNLVDAIWKGVSLIQLVAQPAITCSKLTIETVEQGIKYVQS